ncbi:hypothetical protein SVAN01_11294 [Stagonosporopsis vannaccii]|nr:hypothetical protein SVAN01_11294 [Stagonosporopsis vannaccii]
MRFCMAIFFAAGAASAAVITNRQSGHGLLEIGAQTLVLKEVGGVPGNECLTFRNNGEIVDAACVTTSEDRQLTPSSVGGADVLAVQRDFSNGFRPDLVDTTPCVGFNGTHFKALDCTDPNLDPVSFRNGQLVSASGACQSGHDDAAQITVDPSGQNCVQLTSTRVQVLAS